MRVRLSLALSFAACLASCAGSSLVEDPQVVAGPAARFVELDSILIHYEDSEPGSTKPVLLLYHGFGGNLRNFDPVRDALAEDWRVIAFDRPPFGYSQKALPRDFGELNPYSSRGQAEFGVLLMDALGLDEAVLVGHSAGGAAALAAAARYPDRIRGLLLVSPRPLRWRWPPALDHRTPIDSALQGNWRGDRTIHVRQLR
jgi:pimeloyl-ACP methyl ester carboxylesterase